LAEAFDQRHLGKPGGLRLRDDECGGGEDGRVGLVPRRQALALAHDERGHVLNLKFNSVYSITL